MNEESQRDTKNHGAGKGSQAVPHPPKPIEPEE
jgi:hypothetical protein